MKNIIKILIVLSLYLSVSDTSLLAQNPGPPPPPNHNSEGNQGGGRAPVGGGIFILMALGGSYSAFKGYKAYSKKKRNLVE